MQTAPRLAGVFFEAEPRQPREALPRMDIAAFVGFAAAGPLHTPVPVDDLRRFRELFSPDSLGPDLPLAWDAERGRMETAWLGPAVEAFFRNGGRRCWVVRVAGEDARAHRFPMRGLRRADSGEEALARARSAGSWADPLRVHAALIRERVPLLRNGAEPFAAAAADYRLDVVSAPTGLRRGDLLEVFFALGEPVLYLFLDELASRERGSQLRGGTGFWYAPVLGSPPGQADQPAWSPLTESEGLQWYAAWRSASPPGPLPSVRLLRFEIRTWLGDAAGPRLSDLAFGREHPRFWGRLPTDEEFFRSFIGRETPLPRAEIDGFLAEAVAPRFPLAGPEQEEQADLYLPIGMDTVPDASRALGPFGDLSAEPLVRDGLLEFGAELFLDADLARVGAGALLREAEHKYYVRQEPLRGVHSLLPLEEVTLVAVPDALHRTWNREAPPADDPLPAPRLDPLPDQPDPLARYLVSWSAVAGATAYRLQYDAAPELDEPVTAYEGADTAARVALPDNCPGPRFYRVRRIRHGEVGAWSETRGRILPREDFTACEAFPIVELSLRATATGSSPPQGVRLEWTSSPPEALSDMTFELQESGESDFVAPQSRFPVLETGVEIPPLQDGDAYYRVRVHQGEQVGPWSNTVRLSPASRSGQTLVPSAAYDDGDLLAVQRALVRFCAARGDVLACLALPRHYRRQEVSGHLDALIPSQSSSTSTIRAGAEGVAPLTLGEEGVLSYGALYHPWLATRAENRSDPGAADATVAFSSPEGAILGQMARQALVQGAWLAPANQALAGVLALDPRFPAAEWPDISAAQVNLVIQDPRGFLTLNAETLSREAELRLVNVRRLLILLRRLALRAGKSYVFEPNDADFRGRVRHRFERTLSDLYVRGAFAGPTPETAFRVVADESVNTHQSLELGRFIVELRVAPSRPLAFLRVRLIQTGPEQVVVQET